MYIGHSDGARCSRVGCRRNNELTNRSLGFWFVFVVCSRRDWLIISGRWVHRRCFLLVQAVIHFADVLETIDSFPVGRWNAKRCDKRHRSASLAARMNVFLERTVPWRTPALAKADRMLSAPHLRGRIVIRQMRANFLQIGNRWPILAMPEYRLATAARRPCVLIRRTANVAQQLDANVFRLLEFRNFVGQFLRELILFHVIRLIVVARHFDVVFPELLLSFPVHRRDFFDLQNGKISRNGNAAAIGFTFRMSTPITTMHTMLAAVNSRLRRPCTASSIAWLSE